MYSVEKRFQSDFGVSVPVSTLMQRGGGGGNSHTGLYKVSLRMEGVVLGLRYTKGKAFHM